MQFPDRWARPVPVHGARAARTRSKISCARCVCAADAIAQYQNERDGRDLVFAFGQRALVHFAVDPDEVWMTTRLKGKETVFLPFNRGHGHGAGNPPVDGNWKTHYLWDEVLQADSLLDILQRFMHLEVTERRSRRRAPGVHRALGLGRYRGRSHPRRGPFRSPDLAHRGHAVAHDRSGGWRIRTCSRGSSRPVSSRTAAS